MDLTDLERDVFATADPSVVDEWLRRHIRDRLHRRVLRLLFRSGRLSPVYGVELDDGRRLVVKVYRPDTSTPRLVETVRVQRRLSGAGFPCPEPVDGPADTAGLTAVIETLVDGGVPGDAHFPTIRRTMASTLAHQIDLLRGNPIHALRADPPAWMQFERGPWPTPHDPIFDWSAPAPGYEWVDELAATASDRLIGHDAPEITGHCDWVCQNLRFDTTGNLAVAYDWDSLITISEPVLIGAIAACYPEGSTTGGQASTPAEANRFVADYTAASRHAFPRAHRELAAAATLWVMAYNARCDASFVPPTGPAEGSTLQLLTTHRTDYLRLT